MNIPKETLQLAQFRKTRLDLMLGKTPKDIAALLFRGRITA